MTGTSHTVKSTAHAGRWLLAAAAAVALGTPALASTTTGPGGIATTDGTSELRLWLRADTGVQTGNVVDGYTDAAASEAVSRWLDQSGYGNHAAQATAANQPFAGATFSNGQTGIGFDPGGGRTTSGADFLGLPNFMNFSTPTVIVVSELAEDGSSSGLFMVGGHQKAPKFQMRYHGNTNALWPGMTDGSAPHPDAKGIGSTLAGVNRAPNIYELGLDVTPNEEASHTATLRVRQDGALLTTFTNSSWTPTTYNTQDAPRIGIDPNNISYALNGTIAEVIVYDRALNVTESLIVHNALSAKYGIAITNDVYGSSNYSRDVFGIGRTAAGDHVASSRQSGLALSLDAGNLANGNFVLAGHKEATNAFITGDLGASGAAERWQRVWFVDVTGSAAPQLSFNFDEADLSEAVDGSAPYVLLYSAVNAYDWSILSSDFTVNGSSVEFQLNSGDLADGYYTLGVIPEPASLGLMAVGAGLLVLRRR